MIEVQVGQIIPLTLQVYDGNSDLMVTATLLDKYGKEYFKAKLNHLRSGLYGNFEIEMPELDLVVAQYETSKPQDYELAQDIFKAIPKPKPSEKFLVGEVVSNGKWDDEDIIIGEAYVEEEAENPE